MNKTRFLILQMLTLIVGICIFSSCSGDDYVNSIPANSNALISIDTKKFDGLKENGLIKSLLQTDDIEKCGIDLTTKIYFFETTDGNLGCCMKVSDKSDVDDWLKVLNDKRLCSKATERKGRSFALLQNKWALGYSDKAFIILGPILPTQQAEAARTIDKYLKQDEDHGIKSTPMFDKVDSIDSPVAIVAQVDALPEKLAAPFTIGVPKDADASQLCIAASIGLPKNGCLEITGQPFSFDNNIDKNIKTSIAKLRAIKGKYLSNIPGNALCSIFMNINGKELVDMMHNSAPLGVLLAGMNTAVDMDNILRSVDGEIAFGISAFAEDNVKMSMVAQLANSNFLADVDYWKKSCQQGSSIVNRGKNRYEYVSNKACFTFGVSDSKEFYASHDEKEATAILTQSNEPLPEKVKQAATGKRFCMILNTNTLEAGNDGSSAFTGLAHQLLGNIGYIVYTIK